ncbi:MAG: hypothetical protein Q8Q39_01745 [bacterium]|nr:hypothetical protein [bacterium]
MLSFFRKKQSSVTSGLVQPHMLIAVVVVVVVVIVIIVAIVFSSGKPQVMPTMRREAFDPQVLAVQEGDIPHGFPADLPLEKNEPGFTLTQSTGSLDYLMKTSSYIVSFQTPWSRDEVARRYISYLKDNGYKKDFQEQSNDNSVFLQGFGDDAALSITITEDRQAPPPDLSEEALAQFAENFPSTVRVAISYSEF